jgi:hypothetical protein
MVSRYEAMQAKPTIDDQQRPRSLLSVWLIVAVLLLPVLYVLSSGPVAVYVLSDSRFSYQTRLVFMNLYWPLGLLYHNSETAKTVFEWYYDFWR